MKYNKKQLELIQKELPSYTYPDIEEMYKELLDKEYKPVEFAGMKVYASHMKDIDPTMFNLYVSRYKAVKFKEIIINDLPHYFKHDDLDGLCDDLIAIAN